jgi:hypothetical protein
MELIMSFDLVKYNKHYSEAQRLLVCNHRARYTELYYEHKNKETASGRLLLSRARGRATRQLVREFYVEFKDIFSKLRADTQ